MTNLMNKNHAEFLLGLVGTGSYDKAAVRKAYRTMAKSNHPDMVAARGGDVTEAEKKMAELNEAHQYLSDMFEQLGVTTLTADTVHYGDVDPGDWAAKPEDYDIPEPEPVSEPKPHEEPATRHYSTEGFEFDNESWDAWYAAQEAEKEAARAAAMAEPVKRPFWYRFLSKAFSLDFVWRVIFLVIAINLYTLIGAQGTNFAGTIAAGLPYEFIFIATVFGLMSVINLFTGFLTRRLMKACSFAIDALIGIR